MDDINNRKFYSDIKNFGKQPRQSDPSFEKPKPSYLDVIQNVMETRQIHKTKSFNANISSPEIISQAISFDVNQNQKGKSKDKKYTHNTFGHSFHKINEGIFDDVINSANERVKSASISAGVSPEEAETQFGEGSAESLDTEGQELQKEIEASGGQPNASQRRRLMDLNRRKDLAAQVQGKKAIETQVQKASQSKPSEMEPLVLDASDKSLPPSKSSMPYSERGGGQESSGGDKTSIPTPPAAPTSPKAEETTKKTKSKELQDLETRSLDVDDEMARARAMPSGYGEGGGAEGAARRQAERQARNAAIAAANIKKRRIGKEMANTPEKVAEREAMTQRMLDRTSREKTSDEAGKLASKFLLNVKDSQGRTKTPDELKAEKAAEDARFNKNKLSSAGTVSTPSNTSQASAGNVTPASSTKPASMGTGTPSPAGQSGKFGGTIPQSNANAGGQSGQFGGDNTDQQDAQAVGSSIKTLSSGARVGTKPTGVQDEEGAQAVGSSIKTLSSGARVGTKPTGVQDEEDAKAANASIETTPEGRKVGVPNELKKTGSNVNKKVSSLRKTSSTGIQESFWKNEFRLLLEERKPIRRKPSRHERAILDQAEKLYGKKDLTPTEIEILKTATEIQKGLEIKPSEVSPVVPETDTPTPPSTEPVKPSAEATPTPPSTEPVKPTAEVTPTEPKLDFSAFSEPAPPSQLPPRKPNTSPAVTEKPVSERIGRSGEMPPTDFEFVKALPPTPDVSPVAGPTPEPPSVKTKIGQLIGTGTKAAQKAVEGIKVPEQLKFTTPLKAYPKEITSATGHAVKGLFTVPGIAGIGGAIAAGSALDAAAEATGSETLKSNYVKLPTEFGVGAATEVAAGKILPQGIKTLLSPSTVARGVGSLGTRAGLGAVGGGFATGALVGGAAALGYETGKAISGIEVDEKGTTVADVMGKQLYDVFTPGSFESKVNTAKTGVAGGDKALQAKYAAEDEEERKRTERLRGLFGDTANAQK